MVVTLDGTAAWFGLRSPQDALAGVTDASREMRESHSALTCSSGKKYQWKVDRSMNRGLQSLRMIINITSLAYELTASPRANTRNDTLPYPDHALLTGRLRRCSWERFRAAGRGRDVDP